MIRVESTTDLITNSDDVIAQVEQNDKLSLVTRLRKAFIVGVCEEQPRPCPFCHVTNPDHQLGYMQNQRGRTERGIYKKRKSPVAKCACDAPREKAQSSEVFAGNSPLFGTSGARRGNERCTTKTITNNIFIHDPPLRILGKIFMAQFYILRDSFWKAPLCFYDSKLDQDSGIQSSSQ